MRATFHSIFTTILGLTVSVGMAACDSDSTPADAASAADVADAESAADTGTMADIVTPTDTGASSDAGVPVDQAPAIDAGPTTDQGPTTDSAVPGDLAMPGDAPVTLDTGPMSVNGLVQQDSTPIASARIEVVDASPAIATMSDAAGAWSLTPPPGGTVFLRASKAGYRSSQSYHDLSGRGARIELQLRSSEQVTGLFSALRITESTAQGMLIVRFHMPPGVTAPAGFGVTLGSPGGSRFILTRSGPVAQDRTAAGGETLGIANVPAGAIAVTPIVPTGVTCQADVPLATYRVDPQTFTNVAFRCL
jgi:hypothetical protein